MTLGAHCRVVIVGGSLAGLRAAECLRMEGFAGSITVIGDEPAEPYDRPPLSKQALMGLADPGHTRLARRMALGDVNWQLGAPAVALDRERQLVRLASAEEIPYDRLMIATGVRNVAWPNEQEAALDGVVSVRTTKDALCLRRLLSGRPERVVVVGAGFTGSEIASVCRSLDLEVTVVERSASPLAGAFGGVIGSVASEIQREQGVDLRTGTEVSSIEGSGGQLRAVTLSDGSTLDAGAVVLALGSHRNVEWLAGSRLAAGPLGVTADTGCRVFDQDGMVVEDIFAAGDVARLPHPLYGYQFLSLEHWGNAVSQADVAAHNMICKPMERRAHLSVPVFWSVQFGINIRSVGVPTMGDQLVFTQGSVQERRFAAAYGAGDRTVGAVMFNHAKWADFYCSMIESASPFPPKSGPTNRPGPPDPVPAMFPHPSLPYHSASVIVSGHDVNAPHADVLVPDGA